MRIAFTGRAGSGKTTMAEFLVSEFHFVRYSFAEVIKELADELFDIHEKDRTVLQGIGGKMREIDPEVWIKYLIRKIESEDNPNVVIDDCRYLNESEWLRDFDFTIIKLVGRLRELTPEQRVHPSEMELEEIEADYEIDTGNNEQSYMDLADILVAEAMDEGLSTKYYEKVAEKGNKNYIKGRNFEYRVMALLRRHGWHVMRRFGSKAEHIEGIGKVPTDLTAYKNDTYLIISCKWSGNHPTTPMDDPDWKALVTYCERFGGNCIPVFAGVASNRQVHLVDLRNWSPLDVMTKSKGKQAAMPDEKSMEELLKRAWDCCDVLIQEYKAAKDDPKMRVRWAGELVKMINVMTRLLWRAGATSTEEDITTILQKAEDELGGEKNGT